jgi:cell division protein FtsQ
MKKFRFILIWIPIFIYLIIISGFISESEENLLCSGIKIKILDSTNVRFITRADILGMLAQGNRKILGSPAELINLRELELYLKSNKAIKNSELYFTEKGRLNIEITQHKPLVRIINSRNEGYYLAEDGYIMPLSDYFSPYVIVVSGYIREPFDIEKTSNIMDVDIKNVNKKEKIIYDIYRLTEYINGDDFWRSQIEQIYVNENYEFELIPRVGPHIIELGDIGYFEEKLDKLLVFYLDGLNKKGWNNYSNINLKFKEQIVCKKY